MTAASTSSILEQDASKSGVFSPSDFPQMPAEGTASKKGKRKVVKTRPLVGMQPINVVTLSPADVIADTKAAQILHPEKDDPFAEPIELYKRLRVAMRKIPENNAEEAVAFLSRVRQGIAGMITTWQTEAAKTEVDHAANAKKSEITAALKTNPGKQYLFLTPSERKAMDEKISKICERPNLNELIFKQLHYRAFIGEIKKFRESLEIEQSEINHLKGALNVRDLTELDLEYLKNRVLPICKNRKDVLYPRIQHLQPYVLQAYLELAELIELFDHRFGTIEIPEQSEQFSRGAALNYTLTATQVETYQKMLKRKKELIGLLEEMKTQWDMVGMLWGNKDLIRKLFYLVDKKAIPSDLIGFRYWAEENYAIPSHTPTMIDGNTPAFLQKVRDMKLFDKPADQVPSTAPAASSSSS